MPTRPELRHAVAWSLPAMAAMALSACGGSDAPPTSLQVAQAAAKCSALATASVPASAIGLPTQGAVVTAATLQAADAATGQPESCKVLGAINASNASDPAIKFQLNLPTNWNVKAIQYGGGGLNGTVITGVGQYTHGPAGGPTPLAMGYATFGSDSGHQGAALDGTFGMNAQALANYGGEAVKRAHDTARHLMQQYYGYAPSRMYHIGGSKGGQEGLVAAQRYGADYDGVVAYYPAMQNPMLVLSWYRMWKAAYGTPGAALNAAKQALLKSRIVAACDALDGLADGVISDIRACTARFDVASLGCASGGDEGDACLSDAQIATLKTAASATDFAFPMANGYTRLGGYSVLLGADLAGNLFDSPSLPFPAGQANSYFLLGDPVIRMWYQQDPASSLAGFDERRSQARIQQISALYDASNPVMDAFRAKGGKLILVQGTVDMLVPEPSTSAYFASVQQRYGAATGSFVRYYLQPGFAHGGGDFALSFDALGALDSWVTSGQPLADPVAIDTKAATRGRTRPLCEFPLFPKYKGTGDVNQAASFTCSAS